MSGRFRFDRFELDAGERQLRCDGAPVDVNSRYLDALALLVSEPGKLVTKERFLDEVWRGVPVTDEALTQCIKTLRRHLGDDASRPRLIETVPKHGYRFIARVDEPGASAVIQRLPRFSLREFLLLGAAGTIGGGFAGMLGGLFYGFAGASEPLQPGMGTISVMIVILCLSILVAVIGAAGVSFGIAAAMLADRPRLPWTVLGGAAGGMIVGAVVKLLGIDAFNLLFGRSPEGITGAGEGLLLHIPPIAVRIRSPMRAPIRAPTPSPATAASCSSRWSASAARSASAIRCPKRPSRSARTTSCCAACRRTRAWRCTPCSTRRAPT